MINSKTPGSLLRSALKEEKQLQMVGVINAYAAMMAERTGFKSIYLSGGGVASSSFGLPDLRMTSLNDVLEEVRRVISFISSTGLPRKN